MSIVITKTFRIGYIRKENVDDLARALIANGCIREHHAADGYCSYRYDIKQNEYVFIDTENYNDHLESFDVTVTHHDWLSEKNAFDYVLDYINRPARSTD